MAETDEATVAHVLNRVAFGPREADWRRARQLGAEGYVREQLEPERSADSGVEERLAALPSLGMEIGELYREYPPPQLAERLMRQDQELDEEALQRIAARSRVPLQELGTARMMRAVASTRQLQEVLVDFWFNHFNVFAGTGQVRYLISTYEREAIRPHVLGSFRRMLGEVAHSPAMLVYLDNWRSAAEEGRDVAGPAPRARNDAVEAAVRRMQRSGRMVNPQQMQRLQRQRQGRGERPPGLNENYARELMELHTLGVDGGYTQDDVREVARAFTGWTLSLGGGGGRGRGGGQPGFVFRPDWHDAEDKEVLGTALAEKRGLEDGEQVLDLLAAHPSTANFIATKLCRKFVADDPPADLVDTVAGAFLRTRGNLRATTAAVLLSEEFLGAEYRGAKVKSPLEFLVSTARALEMPLRGDARAATNGALALQRTLRLLGAPLYGATPPTGYPDTAEEWTSANAILARMDVGSRLSGWVYGQPDGTPADARGRGGGARGRGPDRASGNRPVRRGPTGTLAERTDVLLRQILGGHDTDGLRAKIVDWGEAQAETPGNAQIATLILGSPEFQRR